MTRDHRHATGLMLPLLMLTLAAGCASQRTPLATALAPLADAPSLARLPDDATAPVVISVRHGDQPAPDLPPDQVRSLAFVQGLALLEVQPGASEALAGVPAGQDVVVWGSGVAIAKLGPALRGQLARVAASGNWRTTVVPAIATFAAPADDVVAQLVARGAGVGSASGGIVTVSATADVLLDLLNRPELLSLQSPTHQRPTGEITP
jgi:hypothetical protein